MLLRFCCSGAILWCVLCGVSKEGEVQGESFILSIERRCKCDEQIEHVICRKRNVYTVYRIEVKGKVHRKQHHWSSIFSFYEATLCRGKHDEDITRLRFPVIIKPVFLNKFYQLFPLNFLRRRLHSSDRLKYSSFFIIIWKYFTNNSNWELSLLRILNSLKDPS